MKLIDKFMPLLNYLPSSSAKDVSQTYTVLVQPILGNHVPSLNRQRRLPPQAIDRRSDTTPLARSYL